MKKKIEFNRVFEEGKFCRSNFYSCCYLKSTYSHSRIGIIVKKKLGNSVIRNYEKRLVREFYRGNRGLLKNSYDIVVMLKRRDVSFLEKLIDFNNLMIHIQNDEKK